MPSFPQSTTDLLRDAAQRAGTYLEQVRERRVAPTASAVEALEALSGPLPDEPIGTAATCWICSIASASPATVATNAGRYFGFVNGGALPASMAATWLAAAWDQNASLRVMSPAAAALEDVALEWVRDVLGLPAGCGGALSTGATMANFTGARRRPPRAARARRLGRRSATACSARRRSRSSSATKSTSRCSRRSALLGLGRDARPARARRRPGPHAADAPARARRAAPSSACRPAT